MLTENGSRLCVKEPVTVDVHHTRESVEAGGLMSYGADEADSYRRVAYLRGQNPQGSQACRSPGGAADEVRAGDQSKNSQADRSDNSAVGAVSGG